MRPKSTTEANFVRPELISGRRGIYYTNAPTTHHNCLTQRWKVGMAPGSNIRESRLTQHGYGNVYRIEHGCICGYR